MTLSVVTPVYNDMTPIPENIGRIWELHTGVSKETICLDATVARAAHSHEYRQ
jgi:hypothetical protein